MGSGYGVDNEAANWMKTAIMADKLGDDFEKEHISEAYNKLSSGETLPSDMRDSVKLGARKMLADNMEGATIEAEQQIMNDINLKAKETGVAPHNYLRDNIDSYLTSPQNFRAVGKISKMMQERQYADAVYQKSKMEEGKLRYDEAASLVSAAEGLYAKGDITGSKKMIATLSKILPIPGHVALNEETGELEAYATDLDGGGAKKTGDKVNPRGFLDAAKTVTRDEMAYGFGLNSQVIQERNVENLLKASTMTNKAGQMFSGFAVTNPYDGTDTKFVVKEHGTGKDVGQFASMKDAVDNGFTVYDQKFVHGEQLIKNAKQQGQFAAEDQSMQRAEHGMRMESGNENLGWNREKRANEKEMWGLQKQNLESTISARDKKGSAKDEKADALFYKNLFGQSGGSGSDSGAGDPMSFDDMKMYKEAGDTYRGIVDDSLLAPLIKEAAPKAKAAVESGAAKNYGEAFNNLIATKMNMPSAQLKLMTSDTFKSMDPATRMSAVNGLMEKTAAYSNEEQQDAGAQSKLASAYDVDKGFASNMWNSLMPDSMYNKDSKVDNIIFELGKSLGIDYEHAKILYEKYAEGKGLNGATAAVIEDGKKEADDYQRRADKARYLGKPMEKTFTEKAEDWYYKNHR